MQNIKMFVSASGPVGIVRDYATRKNKLPPAYGTESKGFSIRWFKVLAKYPFSFS